MLLGAVLALRAAPATDRAWLAMPLGLYAGWLTAASTVALATVAMGWGLGDPLVLSWVGLALALCLALWLTQHLGVVTYPIAVAWALIGIVVANVGTAPAFAGAALGGAIGVLWFAVRTMRSA